jgi:SAM-dependent methyltransferase
MRKKETAAGFPAEFDVEFYRSKNSDLKGFSDKELQKHYNDFGIKEGRIGSPAGTRGGLNAFISAEAKILEIGPFVNPYIMRPKFNVKYFDVLDTEGLRQRAASIGIDAANVPDIDFYDATGSLDAVNEKFDMVLSSHAIEHQPDLVRHLNKVDSLLNEGGFYVLIIPDKRYCFDHFIPEINLFEVISAFYEKRTRHLPRSVLEHRLATTHNEPARHWRGDNGENRLIGDNAAFISGLKNTLGEAELALSDYVDVHAWQFTPENFRNIVNDLKSAGFINLNVHRIYATNYGSNEFVAILEK